jgi:hypothetical protein
VLVALLPWVTATLPGESDRLKLGVAAVLTVTLSVVVFVSDPEVPVIVTV